MKLKTLVLAAAGVLAMGSAAPAGAAQIYYTTTGVANVMITGPVNTYGGIYLPNITFSYSVVGDTTNYFDDVATGARLIATSNPVAKVSGSGTLTVLNPDHSRPPLAQRPFSFTDTTLNLAGPDAGYHSIFADGFGAFDGYYAYGEVSGSLVNMGDAIGGPGLSGWDGVSAITAAVTLGDPPAEIDIANGNTWNLLNPHNMTFTAVVAGETADTPLVVVGGDPQSTSYHFDFSATGGKPVYVDPDVATGYDYVVGNDSPLIKSAIFPVIGASRYSVFALNDLSTPLFSNVLGGQTIDFTTLAAYANGIAGFALRGISLGAALDPTNTTAFVTALTFVSDGQVSLTQTAVTTYVPEPQSWALMLLGFAGLGGLIRARRRAAVTLAA